MKVERGEAHKVRGQLVGAGEACGRLGRLSSRCCCEGGAHRTLKLDTPMARVRPCAAGSSGQYGEGAERPRDPGARRVRGCVWRALLKGVLHRPPRLGAQRGKGLLLVAGGGGVDSGLSGDDPNRDAHPFGSHPERDERAPLVRHPPLVSRGLERAARPGLGKGPTRSQRVKRLQA